VSRPIVVAWMELRTRTIVGWAIGKSESAHLARQSLAAGLERSRAIPQAVYLDNGRAFASKEMTGGTATRYRFKVRESEMQGVVTALGISVTWAKPYNGRAKPIESFWRTLTEMARRPEFVGAYCGNKPENKPEEHDVKNAVDIALVEKLLHKEIEEYHARPHRGDSMNNSSPNAMYEALMVDAVVTQPTAGQVRRCALASKLVSLNRHGEIFVMGNRYGNAESPGLVRGKYTAYYDPNDAHVPVELWDGQTQAATLPLIARGEGFANRDAAQDHNRAKNAFKRAQREQDKAMQDMQQAADWTTPRKPQAEPGAPLPRAKVARPARLGGPLAARPQVDKDEDELTPEYMEEFRAARMRGEAMRYGT